MEESLNANSNQLFCGPLFLIYHGQVNFVKKLLHNSQCWATALHSPVDHCWSDHPTIANDVTNPTILMWKLSISWSLASPSHLAAWPLCSLLPVMVTTISIKIPMISMMLTMILIMMVIIFKCQCGQFWSWYQWSWSWCCHYNCFCRLSSGRIPCITIVQYYDFSKLCWQVGLWANPAGVDCLLYNTNPTQTLKEVEQWE